MTQPCDTFDSEALAPRPDFDVLALELWGEEGSTDGDSDDDGGE